LNSTPPANWLISATPDPQLVNPDWDAVGQAPIDGVFVRQVKNVITNNGYLTEIFRTDWNLPGQLIDQVFVRVIEPGAVSAWHCHAVTTDRLFCVSGRMLIVLYDGRRDSATARSLLQLRVGTERPALVVVPCGVWHGVKTLSSTPAMLLNAVDAAYAYEAPDHWRIPQHNPDIPFDFATVG
jgi:dTDP-4-dehydrorhamnose 3,5-epimerase